MNQNHKKPSLIPKPQGSQGNSSPNNMLAAFQNHIPVTAFNLSSAISNTNKNIKEEVKKAMPDIIEKTKNDLENKYKPKPNNP